MICMFLQFEMAAVHIEPELENAYRSGHILEVEPHFNFTDDIPQHAEVSDVLLEGESKEILTVENFTVSPIN